MRSCVPRDRVGHVELHYVYETRTDTFLNGSRQALLNDTERK
jgi:hypothetical protein